MFFYRKNKKNLYKNVMILYYNGKKSNVCFKIKTDYNKIS